MKAVIIVLAYIVVLSFLQGQVSSCPKRRRGGGGDGGSCRGRECKVSSWSWWSSCSHRCGSTGERTQSRSITQDATCGRSCTYSLQRSTPCNRYACKHGGTPIPGRCRCLPGWTGTCCESGE